MSTNVKIILDKRNQKQDKTYPLILRIIHNRKSISIRLGYSLLEKDWDEETKEVKKSFTGVSNITRLNKLIHKKKVDAMDIVNQLQDTDEISNLKVKEIKARIVNENSSMTFYNFTNEIINEMESAERFGYARSINNMLQAVTSFTKEKDCALNDLNYDFLVRFENFCRKRGNSTNTIAVYMRTIKMVFNRSIKSGMVIREQYPFTGYKIKTAKTKKRAVPREVIEKIENLKLKEDSLIWHARNYFLFSFYAMGMNFADIAQLKVSNIVEGRIEYRRKKTKKLYSIKITSGINEILKQYIIKKEEEDFIFPILSKESSQQQQYLDFFEKRRIYNKQLKEIANVLGIDTNLTSYVARHSWATIAKHKGVPIAAISEGMGHTDVKTTEIYLDSFDQKVIDDFNELITR